MSRRFAIVTDAASEIGLGHAVRQLAVAEFAQKKGSKPVLFSPSSYVMDSCRRIGLESIRLDALEDAPKAMDDQGIDRVIIDVHERDFPRFRPLCARLDRSVLVVSEVGFGFEPFGDHLVRLGSDLQEWDRVVTQSHKEWDTTIHSGRAYMVFRDEFRPRSDVEPDEGSILIAHGGSDPLRLTERCLTALEGTRAEYKVYVLATRNFVNLNLVEKLVRDSKHHCRLIVDSEWPSEWMRRSMIALINGGNIRYELCMTRTPFIAVSMNQSQMACTQQIAAIGAGVNLGVAAGVSDRDICRSVDALMDDGPRRQAYKQAMQGLFDMDGRFRILGLVEG